MKINSILFVMILFITNSIYSQPIISISGSALSGFSSYDQAALPEKNRQFESEANILLSADLSERAVTNIEFGLGMDNQSGFTSGVGLAAYDFTYQTDFYNTAISVGALTVPYGQFSATQTYNSSVNSAFLYNDLGYTLLAQNNSLVDFAGVGLLTTTELDYGIFKSFIFNGTDANSTNADEGFGVTLHYQTASLVDANLNGKSVDVTFGLSYLNVNDYGSSGSVINADTTGGIIDANVKYDILEFGGYVSILNLNDFNSTTEDEVKAIMIYASRDFGNILFSARYSIITPKDYNGDGVGITSALGKYGLTRQSLLNITDIETTRYQLSAVIQFEENFNLHNEVVLDTYPEAKYDTAAILSYASLTF